MARLLELGPLLRQRYGMPVRKQCFQFGATCPNRDGTLDQGGCIFCAEHLSATPQCLGCSTFAPDPGERRRTVPFIAYVQDHSATHLPVPRLEHHLAQISALPGLVGIHLGTRPDCLPPPTLELLHRLSMQLPLLVELGLQTANEQTLAFVRRRHDIPCFIEAVEHLHRRRIRVCSHVILGLPTPCRGGVRMEGAKEAVDTARLIGKLGIEAVKIHHCHILRGTALEMLYGQGTYEPPAFEEYVAMLIPFLEHLPPDVEIHRLIGEAHPPALIAPAFTATKSLNIQRIRRELDARDIHQGAQYR